LPQAIARREENRATLLLILKKFQYNHTEICVRYGYLHWAQGLFYLYSFWGGLTTSNSNK